ncbi:MAG: tetratricopeptide repeat protein [Terriglobales bacterium]
MSEPSEHLLKQAWQARREDRHVDAQRDLEQAVDICRRADDKMALAKTLTALGQVERDLQHNDVACGHYVEAAAIYRANGDALRLAHAIRHIGDIHRHEQRRAPAERCYREALDIYRAHQPTSPLDLANAIRGLAILLDDSGEADEARALWQEARELYASVNVEAGVAESSRRLAKLAEKQTH